MNRNNNDTVLRNYVTLPHPTAFGGRTKIAKHYNIPAEKVAKILSENEAYTLHREYHKPRVRNPYYIYHIRQQIQMDLIDINQLSAFNDGYKYLICCIDCFSRLLWVRPVKRKSAAEVLTAFKEIIAEMVTKPETILCDRGKEFKNRHFVNYLNSEGIKLIFPFSEVKAGIVERVNRSLQNLIYKFMTENQTRTYIAALPMIVSVYNNRPHRSIDHLTPIQAEQPENAERVAGALRQHYTNCMRPNLKIKYKVGDLVRFKTAYGSQFARGYEEQFSNEFCYIHKINKRMGIPMYVLRSAETNEVIEGAFYQEEIQPYTGEEFKIEKVLKRRVQSGVPHCLVKWVGFADPSWIPESNVTRTFNTDNGAAAT